MSSEIEIQCGYKYRLYPTEKQKRLLDYHFFISNQAYNICLDYQKLSWNTNKELPKENRAYPKASEIDEVVRRGLRTRSLSFKSVIAQKARIHANQALSNALTKKGFGFPQFKNSGLDRQSFSWNNQGYSLLDTNNAKFKTLRLMRENLKMRYHRELPKDCKITSITVSRKAGSYYVSFGIIYNTTVDLISKDDLDIKRAIGIDTNVHGIAFSNGEIVPTKAKVFSNMRYNSKFKRIERRQSRRIERAKTRKVKTGANYRKDRLTLNKLRDKVCNSRTDLLHKITNATINKFNTIVVETLKVKDMTRSDGNSKKRINREVVNASFYRFLSFLKYKAMRNGKMFIEINPAYTSKTCCSCGYIKQDLKVADRIFKCPHCKILIDRDINAAINILAKGLQSLGLGTSLQTINDKPFVLVEIA